MFAHVYFGVDAQDEDTPPRQHCTSGLGHQGLSLDRCTNPPETGKMPNSCGNICLKYDKSWPRDY
jgi:hypothetical protein